MPAYVHKDPSKGPVRDAELRCCMALKHLAACALWHSQASKHSPAYKMSPSYQRDVKEGKEQKE